jgi:hypothetical protein
MGTPTELVERGPIRRGTPMDDGTYRWLHDKFERLKSHEDDLLNTRLEAFYVIQGALITATVAVYATADSSKFLTAFQGIALIGLLLSWVCWAQVAKASLSCRYWQMMLEGVEAYAVETSLKGIPGELSRPFSLHSEHVHQESEGKGLGGKYVAVMMTPNRVAGHLTYLAGIAWALAYWVATLWPQPWMWFHGLHP